MDDRVVGILGGGQLGRMLTEAAHRLNIQVVVLDAENAPAKQINGRQPQVNGSFTDPWAIRRLAEQCDIMTVEIEHVNTVTLEEIANGSELGEDRRRVRERKVEVQPSWRTIRVIQDKFQQKEHLIMQGVRSAESLPLESNTEEIAMKVGKWLGYPFMLKARTNAYDGRGNYAVHSIDDIGAALQALGDRPLYGEKWANFKAELAVMVVKIGHPAQPELWQNTTLAYPVVETVHEDNICKLVYAPARGIAGKVAAKAQDLARRSVAGFWGTGVFGVEMFILEDDTLLVNEIAPRPHNSGHYTIEACPVSQYDAHLRAILGLEFPDDGTSFNTPDTHAIMVNILGGREPDSHLDVAEKALATSGARLHLYGKGDARPGRKMGHITIIAESMQEAEKRAQPLIGMVDSLREERYQNSTASKKSSKPVSKALPSSPPRSDPTGQALIGITMGSDSDLPILKPGIALLRDLNIPYSITITSAHRTPGRMFAFAQEAASKGLKVIIAAAGGAAHLPGMIAASTPLPVIGVPVKGSTLDGMDSLLSIVQMPVSQPKINSL